MKRALLAGAVALATPTSLLANDSTAELGTGGLILSRSDVIEMKREELFISPERVAVDYVFVNRSETDVETIVAFPMPDIENNEFGMTAIPFGEQDNFLGFEVTVDERPVEPSLEHKAFAVGIDISADLTAQNVPLLPLGEAAYQAVAKLPADVVRDWQSRGIIWLSEYDDGSGWKTEVTPFWQLRSTYWWTMTFPAGKEVKVSHRYTPSVGGSAGLNFFFDGAFGGDMYQEYKSKYCLDSAFEAAVVKAAKATPDGYPRLTETRLSYVLTTGGNWALGTIGDLTLTIDKGKPENIVSFCGLGTGVRKVGPSSFQMKAADYYPARDIDVLILQPYSFDGSETSRAAGGVEGSVGGTGGRGARAHGGVEGSAGGSTGGRRDGVRVPAGEGK
ncbi:MAG: DUF4424 domain-containing protein [Rhizobiaceae bacterium]|nr:DUF4424 domain-containing protein [Rhizobiaceae bacterium]